MRAFVIVCLVACGSGSKPTATPPTSSTELSPALAPLAWRLGAWQAESGNPVEHWVAADGAIFGIALHDDGKGFEVFIVDDGEGQGKADGVLRFIVMLGGDTYVEYQKREASQDSIVFATETKNDPESLRHPMAITHAREGERLRVVTANDEAPPSASTSYFKPIAGQRAPALEAADIAFAKDTAARGIEGWVAAFDPNGAMMRKAGRVQGADAIRALMGPVLAKNRVAWAPIASGVRGDIGFTVGKATFTGESTFKSVYVTIWKQQADGSWKVLFDTGRPVQAE